MLAYFIALAASLATTFMLTPIVAALATRLGMLDWPSEARFHHTATPYLGGLAVAGGVMVVGVATAEASRQLLMILVCGLALGVLGAVDDRRGVGLAPKLVLETSAAIALWLVGVRAGLFGVPALDLLLTVVWVVGVTNAFNMVDNMDGICSGVAAIAAFTFFVIAAGEGNHLVAMLALAVTGASLGFLNHNFPPAKIFLGDAGTLLIGFLLASLALKLDLVGSSGLIRTAVPVLLLGVPLFDAAVVLIARTRDGRPVYIGATDHSSHRLALRGMAFRSIALGMYGAQVILGTVALSLFWLTPEQSVVLLTAVGATAVAALLVILGLPWTGSPEPDVSTLPVEMSRHGLLQPADSTVPIDAP